MPAQQIHYHDVAGGAIAFAWNPQPSRIPLVMLHGLGDSAIVGFRDVATREPLSGLATLRIDLPGFGASVYRQDHPATIERYADDIAGLLDAFNVGATSVFGHSMGGNVAISLTLRHPRLVNRLVVAEPLLEADHSVLARDIARFHEAAFVDRRFRMMVRATSLQARRGDIAAGAFLDPLRMAHPVAVHRAACSVLASAPDSLAALERGIGVPTTLLMGSRTTADTSRLEDAAIPIVRIPNAGHAMLAEQAATTAYAILNAIT